LYHSKDEKAVLGVTKLQEHNASMCCAEVDHMSAAHTEDLTKWQPCSSVLL
jgi:hypothetical protein